MRHVFCSTFNCSRLCRHIPLPLQTNQDICTTGLSALPAMPLLHYRERYGRPKSKLQHLCIFVVTLLIDCSLPITLGDSCSTLAILPHRSWSFLVAPGPSSSFLQPAVSCQPSFCRGTRRSSCIVKTMGKLNETRNCNMTWKFGFRVQATFSVV